MIKNVVNCKIIHSYRDRKLQKLPGSDVVAVMWI